MTVVEINPGVCGFITTVTTETEDQMKAVVQVESGCASVNKMMEALGSDFDSYEICLKKPGDNVFYEYAAKSFPVHAACPVIAGIVKCIEAECKLALPRNAEIVFKQV